MPKKGVHTTDFRCQFVQGYIGSGSGVECGDQTLFPLEVTLDQLAEIMYRVKFAEFTSSTLTIPFFLDSGVTSGVNTPRVQYSLGTGEDNYRMSGYWSFDDTSEGLPATAFSLDYLGDLYTEKIAGVYYSFPRRFIERDFRDIGDNEYGLWIPYGDGYFPDWNRVKDMESVAEYYFGIDSSIHGYDLDGFKNAFSWFSSSTAGDGFPPDINIPWFRDISYTEEQGQPYETLSICVEFSGRVAVVGDMSNFFDPANRFFIEMLVTGGSYAFPSTFSSGPIDASPTGAFYTIRLKADGSNDISIPLAWYHFPTFEGEIIHEATEWWPYAKEDPATPVWNSDTGAKL